MSITIRRALAQAALLTDSSDTPRLDAELLLMHTLKCNKSFIYAWPDKLLLSGQLSEYERLLARRRKGEPVAYILGRKEFWSLPLMVNTSTLIPRPETELLVEKALSLLAVCTACEVIDLGTGTGAIALAIASERSEIRVTGCDIESQAIDLANRNKAALAFENVNFIISDWCAEFTRPVDMIVSNPPYIDPDDPHLTRGDVNHEPKSALVSENKGLADIQCIASGSFGLLKPGGWLLFEHGYEQGSAVRRILADAGFENIGTDPDLAGHERISYGRKN